VHSQPIDPDLDWIQDFLYKKITNKKKVGILLQKCIFCTFSVILGEKIQDFFDFSHFTVVKPARIRMWNVECESRIRTISDITC